MKQTPKNVATKVQQRVTLSCAGDVDDTMQWLVVFIDPPLTHLTLTYGNKFKNQFKDTFSLNTDGGLFALVIKSAVLSDGRTYRCKNIYEAHLQHGDAEVIVFGKTYFVHFSLTFLCCKYSNIYVFS